MIESTVDLYSDKLRKILNQPVYRFVTVTSRRVPKESGVYLINDDNLKQIIYAGRSKNLRIRLLQQHKQGMLGEASSERHLGKSTALVVKQRSFEEMVRLEHFVTAILAPILNTELKQ